MKINLQFLPIKGHFFLFLGSVSPIQPSLMVIVKQLGIPVLMHGALGSVILILNVIIKPIVASIADAFPRARKTILLLILTLMLCSYFSINFLPPMHNAQNISLSGDIFSFDSDLMRELNVSSSDDLMLQPEESKVWQLLISNDQGSSCHLTELWDCEASCNSSYSITTSHILLDETLEAQMKTSSNQSSKNDPEHTYLFKMDKSMTETCGNRVSFRCDGGFYSGESCPSLWTNHWFYSYVVLFTVGTIAFNIANSASDAICLDLVGEDGDYGNQRAWGTVGWGLMGPVSGLLIDWYSGDNFGKNYLPAFLILLLFGSADILMSTVTLKMPRVESAESVWRSVGVVVRRPSFAAFLLFVVLAGSFDGIVASYIYVLQEEMAKATGYMKHIKFIQGLTIGAQCLFEAPFMWTCGWFLKHSGTSALLSFVFFLYSVRLFGLALIGSYGPLWATVLIELLNGPCYGLGYTVIVLHAGLMSPPGTSTTVQSITNICYEALGYAVASLLGGIIYTLVGAPGIYYTFGCISMVTFLLHLLSTRMGNDQKGAASAQITEPSTNATLLPSDQRDSISHEKKKQIDFDPQI